MPLPKPNRYDISLTEALTFVAWGEHFSPADFAVVERIPEMESELQGARERRQIFEEKLASLPNDALIRIEDADLQYLPPVTPAGVAAALFIVDDELLTDLLPKDVVTGAPRTVGEHSAEGIEGWNVFIRHLSQEIETALSIKRRMEVANGGLAYWTDEFHSDLTSAAEHFWNACKAGEIRPRGKPGVPWEESRSIPIDWWFASNADVTCLLSENAIDRDPQYSIRAGADKWVDVRVVATEARALRNKLNGQANELAASNIVRTGAPGRPTTRDLYLAEFERRSAQGLLPESLSRLCEELMKWFEEAYGAAHPPLPRLTKKSLEGVLRARYNAHRAKPEK